MSAKGFTLIELLVVMVLMGVILAVVPMAPKSVPAPGSVSAVLASRRPLSRSGR